jgi:multimeric flavodoxin WrbA
MDEPVRIAIAYHSRSGHTARLAEAVAAGAADLPGTGVSLTDVSAMGRDEWRLLDRADALIFGSPTHMGSASAAFHAFAEASSRRWFTGAWRDKLAAGFTHSGAKAGDKSSTLGYLMTFAAQHGMLWVGLGLAAGWNTTRGSEDDLNRLGFWTGAAAQSNLDETADAVSGADLRTAGHLGRRVAGIAGIMVAGRTARAAV